MISSQQRTEELRACGSRLQLRADGRLCFTSPTAQWANDGSLAVLHYHDRQHPRDQVVVGPWFESHSFGTPGTTSLSCRCRLELSPSNGQRLVATLRFDAIGVTVPIRLEILPDGTGFTATIEDGSVREEQPGLFRVLGIELLPHFGAAVSGEEGYLLLPNWFGTQCFFDKDYPREVWQTVYSPNDQWDYVCNMPLFGITREQGTLCGVITHGDYDVQLVCRQHWERQQVNSIHPYLVYRWRQEDEVIAGPRQVQYTFAPANGPDGEGYVFCAKAYRNLLDRRGLMTWAQKADARPDACRYAERFFLKIFLAYKDPQADGQGTYHVGCTFDEARQIIEQCLDRGMDHLTVVLVGWGQDGHDGKVPTYLPPDARLGGEDALRELIEWCDRHDVQLGLHTSHGATFSCSDEFDPADIVVHRNGQKWASIVWSGGQAHRMCSKVAVERYVPRDITAIAEMGIHGHHHYDAVGGFMLCYSPDHPLTTRTAYINSVREECRIALDRIGSLSTEMPFGQYFDVVDGFFHSFAHPYDWHLASPVGRYFYDRTVPLLSTVLHGSANCGHRLQPGLDWRLEMIDWAMVPQTEVSMRPCRPFGIGTYADQADVLAEAYEFFYGEDGLVTILNDARIVRRDDLAPMVSRTEYDNGVVVHVNRSSQQHADLPAMSYRLDKPDQRDVPAPTSPQVVSEAHRKL